MTKSFGAKADNLLKLSEAGCNVPVFYILPAALKTEIGSSKTQEKLKQEFISWRDKNNVRSAAIRSSSSQEDSKNNSFAGQFTTVLDVQDPNNFICALKTVFESAPSDSYSTKAGHTNAIVQKFVEPDFSGVAFSINPSNGNQEFVINAASGRGTNVVEGGEVEQCFVSRLDSRKYHRESKLSEIIVTTESMEKLVNEVKKIESLFAYPQDIEWAFKGGVLYVLQARPITRIHHLKVWDSSNIAESFPGIVLPLTFSIARKGYVLGYKAQAYSGGLSWYDVEAHHREFDSMVGIFNGRMYYNLLSWYKIISLFPGGQRNQKFLDDQIATQGGSVYQLPVRHSLGFTLRYVSRLVYRALFFKHELHDFYARYSRFESEMKHLSAYGDFQLLMQQYAHIEQTIIPHFGRTLDNDFLVMTYHGLLKKLLQKWLPGQPYERNSIIGSMSGVMSAKQALSLYDLAEQFKAEPEARKLLQSGKFDDLDNRIKGAKLEADIHEYLEVFGHRFAEDQKIEIINPTLEPHGIYKLVQAYIQLDYESIQERLSEGAIATKALEGKVANQLKLSQRLVYKLLLRRLKHHLRLREKNRLLRGRTYGYLRDLFPKVGHALAEEGVVKSKEDVYYLLIEEIYELLQGTLITNDLQSRINKRREAYEEFKKVEMPERFITKNLPSLEKVEPVITAKGTSKVKASLGGLISSPGTVEGRVIVLSQPKIPDEPYDILVAKHTDPGWTPLIALAKGVIVEYGGMLSHAAIVTRELGIPSIIGVEDATKVIKTGMRVRINTQLSSVEILDRSYVTSTDA